MKTAEQKVDKLWVEYFGYPGAATKPWPELKRRVLELVKEQDRDTRHTCAEAVLLCREACETPTGDKAISPDDAHAVCMNAHCKVANHKH